MTETKSKSEIVARLLDGLRQDIVEGNLTLYRERLTDDVVVLAMDSPRILEGKKACLEYFRGLGQAIRFRELRGAIEAFKLLGDIAVVVETYTTQYESEGESYRDTARVTSILTEATGKWMLTHVHLESLAPNRIIA